MNQYLKKSSEIVVLMNGASWSGRGRSFHVITNYGFLCDEDTILLSPDVEEQEGTEDAILA